MKKIYKLLKIRVKYYDSEDIVKTSEGTSTIVDEFDNTIDDIFS